MSYSGWELLESSRTEILNRFPPKYDRVIAHHITYGMGELDVPEHYEATVVGYADDGKVESLIVKVSFLEKQKLGRPLHITLSLNPLEAKPVDGGTILERTKMVPVEPFLIKITPKVFR